MTFLTGRSLIFSWEKQDMLSYFECLHCGLITPTDSITPKCRGCGHGTGVLHTKEPDKTGKKHGEDPNGRGGGPPKPKGAARVLAALNGMTGLRAAIQRLDDDALPGAAAGASQAAG